MEDGEQICGVVASIRRNQCRISLWTRDGPNEAVQVRLSARCAITSCMHAYAHAEHLIQINN